MAHGRSEGEMLTRIMLLGLTATAAANAVAQTPRVTVTRLLELPTSQGKAVSLAYTYSFPGRQSVYIKGVGTVPASGSFEYLSMDRRLEFRDASDGSVLLHVPLNNPEKLLGRETTDVPSNGEFPAAARNGRWTGPGSFPVHAERVLSRSFSFGSVVSEVDGQVMRTTTYHAIDVPASPLKVNVAVKVTYPAAPKRTGHAFSLHVLVKERRSRSEWRPAESEDALRAVETFIASLLAALEKP